jgi:hypothetical protein
LKISNLNKHQLRARRFQNPQPRQYFFVGSKFKKTPETSNLNSNLTFTMRIIVVLFFLTLQTFQVNGQRRNFDTQGEFELFEAKKLFKKQYKKEKHELFKGKIEKINETTFLFDKMKLEVFNTEQDLLVIFENGILSPWTDGLSISNLEELIGFSKKPQMKRFKFLLFRKGFANPIVYFIELTNKNIKSDIDLKTFLNGAKLTFFKQGGLQI